MNDASKKSGSPASLIFALLMILLLGIGGLFFYQQIDPSQTDSTTDVREAMILKNRSLAELENNELDDAANGFRKLMELAPHETLGTQNLAVTLLIQLTASNRTQDADQFATLQTQLDETLSEWTLADPESRFAPLISAYRHEALEDRDRAIADFLKAADRKANDPAPLFQAYELMQQRVEEYPAEEREDAISQAYKRAPENLGVVITYLRHLAEVESDQFPDVLDQSRSLFLPLSARVRDTLPKLLDKAGEAAKEGDWSTVKTQIGFTGNLLLAEIAYTNDLNRLNPHPLEFVAMDFSPNFYTQTGTDNTSPSISVTFNSEPLSPNDLEEEITAFTTVDLTLDGNAELIVSVANRVLVYELPNCEAVLFEWELPFSISGITAADLDRDYQSTRDEALKNIKSGLFDTDLDLIVWGSDGIRLLENTMQQGDTKFTLSLKKPSPELEAIKQVSDVRVTDLDHDGDLDLAVLANSGMSLWSNNGNWSFENFTPFSHLPDSESGFHVITSADLDRNVLNDFLVASDEGIYLLENNLHGRYVSRLPGELKGKFTAIQVIDLNRDASWDLLAAGPQGITYIPGVTLNEGGWKPREGQSLSEQPVDDLAIWDYNNDGLLDVVAWDDDQVSLLSGTVAGGLKPEAGLIDEISGAKDIKIYDFDRDGDEDLIVLQEGNLSLVTNNGGNSNKWIDVRLRAEEIAQTPRERCNMHGVGSLLELKAGGLYQSRTVEGPLTHFGIGQKSAADILRVLWTNGIPHNVISPETNGLIFEQQQLKGSCPYLYTWDGEKFVFATDCLWASPIGLQFAQGILAPAREWEYLKISGHQFKPKDDAYVLQMTEELWEAAYYDSVKLMAVDHPAEIEVYTNEKVGPAEIAEFQVHTVRQKQRPQSVVDQRGRDLLSEVELADGIYTRTWEKSYTQGLTETHWLEIDLGKLEDPESLKLFLTGWVFPTDTSLNIAISQNPERPRSQPPALQVPDTNGEWQTVSPYIGFPGGKTKTIVVDLTDRFLTDDYRLRIVTNMEIRWDEVFFTIDEAHGDYQLTDLSLLSADLHYRGFSTRQPRPHNQPEFFDYQKVLTNPLWPPMGGNFTRYGSVTELIEQADDRQAVLGAGDEMTVRFEVPQKPLPKGWVRDFILYNIGWDKDADLNTVQGQQVEPLPFRAMKSYPYEPEQSFPSTPAHQEYLWNYQTRHQPRTSFRTDIRDWRHEPTSPQP